MTWLWYGTAMLTKKGLFDTAGLATPSRVGILLKAASQHPILRQLVLLCPSAAMGAVADYSLAATRAASLQGAVKPQVADMSSS
jgi:hypothetical protein